MNKEAPSNADRAPGNADVVETGNELLDNVSSGKGRSTLHGLSYQLLLGLVVLLRAFRMYQLNRSFNFLIAMEDPAGKDFDDIMYHYKSGQASSGTVSIQAKHKRNDQDGQKDEQDKRSVLTEDELHARWNSKQSSFSIEKYFLSFLEVEQHLHTDTRTYVLCTNRVLDKSLEGQFSVRQQQQGEDVLQFCYDIGATCYQINPQHTNKRLEKRLANCSLEKLGKLLATEVFKGKKIVFKDSLCYTHAKLLSDCLEPLQASNSNASRFKFKEVFLNAPASTTMGILQIEFANEYKKLVNDKKTEITDMVKKVVIEIDRSSFSAALSKEASTEENISKFYKSFVLVCQTLNEDKLYSRAVGLLPKWSGAEVVLEKLHRLVFNAMKSVKPVPIDLKFLQQKFIEVDPNVDFTLLKSRSKEYCGSLEQNHPLVLIDPDRLRRSGLNAFITSDAAGAIYEFNCSVDMNVSCLLVAQTLALHQYEALFLDSAMYHEKNEMLNILNDLLSYLRDVDHPTIRMITILGKLEHKEVCEVKKLCESYDQKVVIVEHTSTNIEMDRLFVHDLTAGAKEKLFQQHANQIIFGTVTPLSSIINAEDDLSFLLNVLELFGQPEHMARHDSIENNYDRIKPWYINRQFISLDTPQEKENVTRNDNVTSQSWPYGYQNKVPFAAMAEHVLHNDSDTMSDIRKALTLNDETHDPPGLQDDENKGKVQIFLNEAGAGKTTYFTWLAWRLSTYDRSLYVIKLIALEYSTDFERLEESGIDHWNDTQFVRLLYRFIHLTLFVPSVCRRTIEETDIHRTEADRCGELLSLSNGKIILDETRTKELTTKQLIELRLFREKFNRQQLVLILDGFDEITPYFKDVVMKCFARFANFEGIRRVYLSSRPQDLKEDLKKAFNNCKMNRLKILSRHDVARLLHLCLAVIIDDYGLCDEERRVNFVTVLYVLITDVLKDSVTVPLMLDMVLVTLLSAIREHVDFKTGTISNDILSSTELDMLQLVRQFIDKKLEILNIDKSGTTNSSAKTPVARKRQEQENKRIKERLKLMAMYALFDSNDRAKLLSSKDKALAIDILEEVMEGEDQTGIIVGVQDGVPQFAHRMFAEYFVACWLYQNVARFKVESVFQSRTIWTDTMAKVREFFNRMILQESEGCNLHRAVLDKSFELTRGIVMRDLSSVTVKDKVGRLPLQIDPSNVIVYEDWLLERIPCEIINHRDDLLRWNALDYAFVFNNNIAIDALVKCGVQLSVEILLQQLYSNDTDTLFVQGSVYAWNLQRCGKLDIANEILASVVDHLLNERKLDIYKPRAKLNSLTILEFCATYNDDLAVHQFVRQVGEPLMQNLAAGLGDHLFQIAFEKKAHKVTKYLIAQCNLPLPWINDIRGLINAVKCTIEENNVQLFKILFQQLCRQREVRCRSESDIVDDIDEKVYEPLEIEIGLQNECCVHHPGNVQLPLPEYTFADDTVEEYMVEFLVTTAVHTGNVSIVSYILQKMKTIVTNRLIVTVMRLLPKTQPLCHKHSIPAFKHLLNKTIDLRSVDEMGRNLFHMIAQNGCFYMLPCLIAKGFHPNEINPKNNWNGFQYLVSSLDVFGLRVTKAFRWLQPYFVDVLLDWKAEGENAFNFAITRSQRFVAQTLFQTHYHSSSDSERRDALYDLIAGMLSIHDTGIVLNFLIFSWFNSGNYGMMIDETWFKVYDDFIQCIPVV